MTTLVEPFPPWLRDINRFFSAESGTTIATFVPSADVLVDDDCVTVFMDVPGVLADKLDIELENDALTVSGERSYPYADKDGAVRRTGRGFGRFERSLRVPRGLDADSIEASLRDGVLTLHLPRPASLQPRKIEVRAEGGEPRGTEASTSASNGN